MFKKALILVVTVILVISCDVTGNTTLNKTKLPELRLVSVGTDAFSKANISARADIDFGDVLATKKLYYLIENTGEIPVFNVRLTTAKDSIEISPNSIGSINPEGSAISTTPIISIICPHVIPTSGVGSLMPMSIGELSDSLFINYQFIAPFDSAGTWAEGDTIEAQTGIYTLQASKKGIILKPYYDDELVWDSQEIDDFRFSISAEDYCYIKYYNADSLYKLFITNAGNENIEYEIMVRNRFQSLGYDTAYFGGWLNSGEDLTLGFIDEIDSIIYDTTEVIIADSTSLDTTYEFNSYEIIKRYIDIEFINSPYIISVKDNNFVNGDLLMRISVQYY